MSGGPRPPVPGLIPLAALSRRPPSARLRRRRRRQRQELIDATATESRGSKSKSCATNNGDAAAVGISSLRRPHNNQHQHHQQQQQQTNAAAATTTTVAVGKQIDICRAAPALDRPPRVNPIFVWVRQEDTRIVDVKCEDYDKRNRILLTKTAYGWRAIPRTERLAGPRASAETMPSSLSMMPPLLNTLQHTHNYDKHQRHHHHHHHHHHHKRRARKSKNNNVKSASMQFPEIDEVPRIEIDVPSTLPSPVSDNNTTTINTCTAFEPSWITSENVNIETFLPSHTIPIKKEENSTEEELTNVNDPSTNQTIQNQQLKERSIPMLLSQTPPPPPPPPVLSSSLSTSSSSSPPPPQHSCSFRIANNSTGDVNTSPLDNLLAVAELELKQQQWHTTDSTKANTDQNVINHYQSEISGSNEINDILKANANFSDEKSQQTVCSYNDDDEIAIHDILSKLEESLQSPQSYDNQNIDDDLRELDIQSSFSNNLETGEPKTLHAMNLNDCWNEFKEETNEISLYMDQKLTSCDDTLEFTLTNQDKELELETNKLEENCKIDEAVEVEYERNRLENSQETGNNAANDAKEENADDQLFNNSTEISAANSEILIENEYGDTENNNANLNSSEYDDSTKPNNNLQAECITECSLDSFSLENSANDVCNLINSDRVVEEEREEKEQIEEESVNNNELQINKETETETDNDPLSVCLDLSIKRKSMEAITESTTTAGRLPLATHINDDAPTDLSIRKHCSASTIPLCRPLSQNSETTIQSPQPSGIPAVPISPDMLVVSTTIGNSIISNSRSPTTTYLESVAPSVVLDNKKYYPEMNIVKQHQKEPLNLGKCRKSASPTVTCSEEIILPPPLKKTKSDVNLKMNYKDVETKKCLLSNDCTASKLSTNNGSNSFKYGSPIEKLANQDPLSEFKQLLLEFDVPNPLVIPKKCFRDVLKHPRREILKILNRKMDDKSYSFENTLILNRDKLLAALEANGKQVKNNSKTSTAKANSNKTLTMENSTNNSTFFSTNYNKSKNSIKQTPDSSSIRNDTETNKMMLAFNPFGLWPTNNYPNPSAATAAAAEVGQQHYQNSNTTNDFIQALYAASASSIPYQLPNDIPIFDNKVPPSNFLLTYLNSLEMSKMSMWQEAIAQNNLLMMRDKGHHYSYENAHLEQINHNRNNLDSLKLQANNRNSRNQQRQQQQPQQQHLNSSSKLSFHDTYESSSSSSNSKEFQQKLLFHQQLEQRRSLMQKFYHQSDWQNQVFNGYDDEQFSLNTPFHRSYDCENNIFNTFSINSTQQKHTKEPVSVLENRLQLNEKVKCIEQQKLHHDNLLRERQQQQQQQQQPYHYQQPKQNSKLMDNDKLAASSIDSTYYNHLYYQQHQENKQFNLVQPAQPSALAFNRPIDLSGPHQQNNNGKSKNWHNRKMNNEKFSTSKSLISTTKHFIDDVPEVGSTTGNVDDIHEGHSQLWHPLFGSHKGYNQWHFPSLAVTGGE